MKQSLLALSLFGATAFVSTPAVAEGLNPFACITPDKVSDKIIYDAEVGWFSTREPDTPQDFAFAPDTFGVLKSLSNKLASRDKALSLFIVPAQTFFMPPELYKTAGKTWIEERVAVSRMIATLDSMGIDAPDLYKLLEEDGSLATYPRWHEHHWSGQGVLDAGRLFVKYHAARPASEAFKIQLEAEIDPANITWEPTTYLSNALKNATDSDCMRNASRFEDRTFNYVEARLDDDLGAALFGGPDAGNTTKIIYAGSSFGNVHNSGIARSIELYSGQTVSNQSIDGGRSASAMDATLRRGYADDPSVSRFIWEAPIWRFRDYEAFGAGIQLLGALRPTCSKNSPITYSQDGSFAKREWAIAPHLFISEDVMELRIPNFIRGRLALEFDFIDGTTRSAEMLRFQAITDVPEPDLWRIALPGAEGWQGRGLIKEIRFRPIQFIDDETAFPESYDLFACWSEFE